MGTLPEFADFFDFIVMLVRWAKTVEAQYPLGRRLGGFADGCDWYRVATETGQTRMGEYRRAAVALYLWTNSGKSLDRLQKEGKITPYGQ